MTFFVYKMNTEKDAALWQTSAGEWHTDVRNAKEYKEEKKAKAEAKKQKAKHFPKNQIMSVCFGPFLFNVLPYANEKELRDMKIKNPCALAPISSEVRMKTDEIIQRIVNGEEH